MKFSDLMRRWFLKTDPTKEDLPDDISSSDPGNPDRLKQLIRNFSDVKDPLPEESKAGFDPLPEDSEEEIVVEEVKETEPELSDEPEPMIKEAIGEIKSKLDDRVDDIIEKFEKREKMGTMGDPVDVAKSLLEDHDDFFARAERFGETGLESAKPDSEGGTENKSKPRLPGFEDRDGDGDELIDDAVEEKED